MRNWKRKLIQVQTHKKNKMWFFVCCIVKPQKNSWLAAFCHQHVVFSVRCTCFVKVLSFWLTWTKLCGKHFSSDGEKSCEHKKHFCEKMKLTSFLESGLEPLFSRFVRFSSLQRSFLVFGWDSSYQAEEKMPQPEFEFRIICGCQKTGIEFYFPVLCHSKTNQKAFGKEQNNSRIHISLDFWWPTSNTVFGEI